MRTCVALFALALAAGCTRENPNLSCIGSICLGGGAPDLGVGGGGHGGSGGGGGNGGNGGSGGSGGNGGGPADMTLPPLGPGNKVDVLFMIDNSPSMAAMQAQLKSHFADFFMPLQALAMNGTPIDLHIGVVTSDYGAGAVDDSAAGCQRSPGGQKGILQTTAAASDPAAGCAGPVGARYITYSSTNGAISSNVPAGSDIVTTFGCMASVGSQGCGFEHQLESVYAALHNGVENAGFLRPDALLAVVFLTNEDDGSAPPTTDIFNPDPAKTQPPPMGYGALDTYRQTRFGVACGAPPMLTPYGATNGPLSSCAGAPNGNGMMLGAEYDVSRYINLFALSAAQGGIKADPRDVVLIAIDAPDDSVEIVEIAAGTGNGSGAYPNPAAYQPCAPPGTVDGHTCLVRLQHSCQNHVQPGFFGDPAVRLNSVVRAVGSSEISSICGANLDAQPDYTNALSKLADVIKSRLH